MRIGVVGTPGGWSSELLADTVERRTGFRLLIEMKKARLELPSGRVLFGDHDLSTLDGLIVKKIGARYSPNLLDRLEILRLLEGRGLPIFSAPSKIMRVLDRLSCTVTLSLAGIPMPPTTITEDPVMAAETLKQYGEAVLKPLYTSKARGMVLYPQNGLSARETIENYRRDNTVIYIQKKIDLAGKDLGVVFLGGEYLTTYSRVKLSDASWNTTTESGGRYASFTPESEIIALAKKAQEPFGLSFTCVDVALGPTGPCVFEVSAFGGFRGMAETSGMNAAEILTDHCISMITRNH
ncbi:MAG: GAK system ATP-grasp enzyme [Deltaproteobacteria bacterium]|nr:GAK system ATP-grasp enzyme [Deltaproteobacteria bacterium]